MCVCRCVWQVFCICQGTWAIYSNVSETWLSNQCSGFCASPLWEPSVVENGAKTSGCFWMKIPHFASTIKMDYYVGIKQIMAQIMLLPSIRPDVYQTIYLIVLFILIFFSVPLMGKERTVNRAGNKVRVGNNIRERGHRPPAQGQTFRNVTLTTRPSALLFIIKFILV